MRCSTRHTCIQRLRHPSAFVGKGKTAALKLIQTRAHLSVTMGASQGQSFMITPQTMLGCMQFVCAQCGKLEKIDVNEAREVPAILQLSTVSPQAAVNTGHLAKTRPAQLLQLQVKVMLFNA